MAKRTPVNPQKRGLDIETVATPLRINLGGDVGLGRASVSYRAARR